MRGVATGTGYGGGSCIDCPIESDSDPTAIAVVRSVSISISLIDSFSSNTDSLGSARACAPLMAYGLWPPAKSPDRQSFPPAASPQALPNVPQSPSLISSGSLLLLCCFGFCFFWHLRAPFSPFCLSFPILLALCPFVWLLPLSF